MSLQKVPVHFGDIAEKVASGIVGIHAGSAGHTPEFGELVGHFYETAVLLLGNLAYEGHCPVSDSGAVHPVLTELVPDVLRVQIQYAAQLQSVERTDIAGGDHNVIGIFVAYQYLAVAVQD